MNKLIVPLKNLIKTNPNKMIKDRINKFSKMGILVVNTPYSTIFERKIILISS